MRATIGKNGKLVKHKDAEMRLIRRHQNFSLHKLQKLLGFQMAPQVREYPFTHAGKTG